MGTRTKSRSSGVPGMGSKMSLPLVLMMCTLCFLAGVIYSRRPTGAMPDLKRPGKAASEAQHLTSEAASDVKKAAGAGDITEGRELREGKPKPLAHGMTGDNFVSEIPFQVLSWYPRAILFPKFADMERCEAIVRLAKRHLAPSGLALRSGESEEGTKDIRTSSGTFLNARQDPSGALAWIERKIAKVTMVPVNHGEAFNVLRYEIGQKYNSHYDTFNPDEYGPQSSQRIASVLVYLTDVEEGGETMFPFENWENMDSNYDFKACIGLKVKPRQGDALLFWSVYHNGTIDKTSAHGSCPVVRGEKWVATKWVRDHAMRGR
eukprot:jgi/Mesen1/2066/ME000150S01151